MKSTFLVFQNINAPEDGLRIASRDEWDQILKINKTLPREKRRFFIEDKIFDMGEIDCMFIETTRDKYNEWHKEKMKHLRDAQNQPDVMIISGDVIVDADGATVFDTIADSDDVEKEVTEKFFLQELRRALSDWHGWAVDFLDLYLADAKKESVNVISQKYGVTDRAARMWKASFEQFIKMFLEKNSILLPF